MLHFIVTKLNCFTVLYQNFRQNCDDKCLKIPTKFIYKQELPVFNHVLKITNLKICLAIEETLNHHFIISHIFNPVIIEIIHSMLNTESYHLSI